MGDDTNPLMMAIWIIPIILFVFYGQRIQLYITSGEIKKGIKKLDGYKEESRIELIDYVTKNLKPKDDSIKKIDRFLDHFTIMPVDMDPNGIVDKVRHTVRSREDYTREHVKLLSPGISDLELTKVQTLLEIASSLQMIYKIVNHMFLTAKKQNNYPLILPLQMLLPFIMEQAEAIIIITSSLLLETIVSNASAGRPTVEPGPSAFKRNSVLFSNSVFAI